jgi:hypothetical protein
MNRFTAPALKLVLGATVAFMLFAGPAQAAQKVPATVRVVTNSGKILVDKKLKTGTTTVKSSASAKCFGDSSTNASKTIPGATALGLLSQASKSVKTLRPLSITNAMDFGLGICGIGGFEAKPTGFWLLKHNHADAMLGAEALTLKKNDVVLFYQVDDYNLPTPAELFVKAPAKVKKGVTAKVRVFAYDSKGKRKPAKGAKLSAGGAVTDAKGFAKVKVTKQTKIIARLAGTIPSNRAVISLKK